jgi:hypothetical protein
MHELLSQSPADTDIAKVIDDFAKQGQRGCLDQWAHLKSQIARHIKEGFNMINLIKAFFNTIVSHTLSNASVYRAFRCQAVQ